MEEFDSKEDGLEKWKKWSTMLLSGRTTATQDAHVSNVVFMQILENNTRYRTRAVA